MLPRTYMKALRMARAYDDKHPNTPCAMTRFTAAQATYWFLTDYHRGQFSPEYAELSWLSQYYKPGAHESGPSTDDETGLIYAALVEEAL